MTQLPNLSVQIGCEKCGHPFEAVWDWEREHWATFATPATNCACFNKILNDMQDRPLDDLELFTQQLADLAWSQHHQIDHTLRDIGYHRHKEGSHHG